MKKNKIVKIAPVVIAGILTLTVLAAISSTNQALAQQTCDLTVNVSPATAGPSPHDVTGKLTCGGSGVGGATITFTSYKSGLGLNPNEPTAKILSPAVTNADGTYSVTGSVCAGAVCSSVIAHYAGDSEHSPAKSRLFSLKIG
jgi:hypothetical protein